MLQNQAKQAVQIPRAEGKVGSVGQEMLRFKNLPVTLSTTWPGHKYFTGDKSLQNQAVSLHGQHSGWNAFFIRMGQEREGRL